MRLFSKYRIFGYFILIITLYSCNKEDKPCEESPDRCEALFRDWEIDGLYIDGVDSLPSFMLNEGYCTTYTFELIYYNYYFIGKNCNGNPPTHEYWGEWYLNDDHLDFDFQMTTPEPYWPLFLYEPGTYWNIELLTKEEILLKQTFQNRNYEIHFKAK